MCYYYKQCDAYVWCKNNTKTALGSMANKELRAWRIKAHNILDPIRKNWIKTRGQIYKDLEKHFWKEIHVWRSNIEMCKNIINYLETYEKN